MSIIFRALVAAAVAIGVGLAVRDSEQAILLANVDAVAGFLHVLGAIYGVVLAFLIFVVWEQFNGTDAGVAREGRAIVELARLCKAGRGQGCKEVIDAIHHYANVASEDEWKLLAVGKRCPMADQAFLKVQEAVLKSDASTEIEMLTRDTILQVAARAAGLRAERIALANTRIPHTLWKTILFATLVLCVSVSLLGVTHPALSVFLTGGITLVVTLILGVVADMDNPFFGVYNASKQPLDDLKHV